jgi:outer membrane protein
MKRVFPVVLSLGLGSALACASIAAAQTSTAPRPAPEVRQTATAREDAAPTRVAVISFQAAVGRTNEFQRDFADLQKKYAPREASLKSLNDEIDTLTKQLQAQGTTLSDDEREAKARAIDEKKKQLDRDTQDAQGDFQADMQDLLNKLASKVGAVMTDYAQKHGYTLVLDASEQQQQAPTVLYALPSTDITQAVIDAYNEKSGIPAPTPASAPTPDAPAPSTSH